MPKWLERKERRKAKRMFPGDEERQNAYVAGVMHKAGYWQKSMPKKEKKQH